MVGQFSWVLGIKEDTVVCPEEDTIVCPALLDTCLWPACSWALDLVVEDVFLWHAPSFLR